MLKLSTVSLLLDVRRDQGRVRRCHGDLHLGNICLFEGRPTPFDCIEFSDDISCIDVLYDLAFLLMDVVQQGLDDLANIVFNRYIDISADLGGLAGSALTDFADAEQPLPLACQHPALSTSTLPDCDRRSQRCG
jgi:uncharacterized protein